MSGCRFMHQNLITTAEMLTLSSARPGAVGTAAARGQGGALAFASGSHTAGRYQSFVVEIDSTSAGQAIGQATFRWMRADAEAWEAGGVATTETKTYLADGLSIHWLSSGGDDFALGDAWTIVCPPNHGQVRLLDGDRDTMWRATGCLAEYLEADLGRAEAVTSLILADHNLSDTATAVLKADDGPDWEDPAFSMGLTPGGTHLTAFFSHTARHWRLELADGANADGEIRASMLYLGPHFSPARNFGAKYGRTLSAVRSLATGDGGKLTGSVKALGVSFSLPFSGLSEADAAGLEAMSASVHDTALGRLRPLFFCPDDSIPADTHYCLPSSDLARTARHMGRWSLTLALEEVVRADV